MTKIILSFDISSSCIGHSTLIIDEKDLNSFTPKSKIPTDLSHLIKFKSVSFIQPQKTGTLIQRLADARNQVQQVIEQVKPDYIALEELIQYMPGKSSAASILTLCAFNRMIGLLAYDYLTVKTNQSNNLFMINVLSIRHGLKLTKALPAKEEMPKLLEDRLLSGLFLPFPWVFKKSRGEKSVKKPIPKVIDIISYDMADGLAVGAMCALYLLGFKKQAVKKPKKRKKK